MDSKTFLDQSVQSINKNRQLAKLSGTLRKTRTVTNSDVTLYDYDSGEVIFLAITGGSDVTITLPEPDPKKTGLNFTFIATASPSGVGDAVIAAATADTIVTQAIVPAATAQTPRYTLTAAGALVASNTINMDIDDTPIAQATFATNSNTTLAAIATRLQASSAITTAVVTDAGPEVDDDRLITVTGANAGVPVILSTPIVAAGSSQTTFTVATTRQPMLDTDAAAGSNLLADNVKLETAALGGEWIEFISDGTYWYCRATGNTVDAITLNG
jgi:hypothetical protein